MHDSAEETFCKQCIAKFGDGIVVALLSNVLDWCNAVGCARKFVLHSKRVVGNIVQCNRCRWSGRFVWKNKVGGKALE